MQDFSFEYGLLWCARASFVPNKLVDVFSCVWFGGF